MISETLLFWLVLFAFLVFDNCVIVSADAELLTLNRKGWPRYVSRRRNRFGTKEMVLLNPLNLFDGVVVAPSITLFEDKHHYKQRRRELENFSRRLSRFSYIGYVYLALLIALCFLSLNTGFEAVVVPLLVVHLSAWAAVAMIAWGIRKHTLAAKTKLFSTLLEALFVPAYLVNFNKKILRQCPATLSALRLHVRQLKCAPSSVQELIRYELEQRLRELTDTETDPRRSVVIKELQKCLTTSA